MGWCGAAKPDEQNIRDQAECGTAAAAFDMGMELHMRHNYALKLIIFLLPLGILSAISSVTLADAPPADIPFLDNIVIDGNADDWADRGYRIEVLEPMGGPTMKPRGQRVQATLAWNHNGLLMLVCIWDDVWLENPLADRLNEGDCIETFLHQLDKGTCHWAFSPGMDPRHPSARWHLFDNRNGEALRLLPAEPVVARTRKGNDCIVEILLPWSALAIEPKERTEADFWFWVADRDGPPDDIRHAWKNRFTLRLAPTASPPQDFLHRTSFNAKAMLTSIIVDAGPKNLGKRAQLADGKRVLSDALFVPDESGYAVAELLVPERAPGTPPYGELSVLVDGHEAARTAAPDPEKGRAEQFLFSRLAAKPASVFQGAALPTVDFEDPERIATAIGRYSLKTTYYDSTFKPVTRADAPGRYAAVVDVAAADGRTCRRFLTLFRQPEDPVWLDKVKSLNLPPPQTPLAAVAWAALYETAPDERPDDFYAAPAQKDRQWWLDFKRRFYGWDTRWPRPFACPRANDGPPAPVVRAGTLREAGMKPDAAARIDAVLTQWAADTDEPFAACVVRHGVIVLHKAYGTREGRPMSVDDPRFLASLTKFLSATLLLTFVDQGLIDLDAPVADYLPPFRAARSNKPLTLRHLYTHTSGFEWHWGASENDLEERLAFHMPNVRVGEQFIYNGTGFDLGSKVLEAVSGECLPALYHRHILQPLGCRGTTVPDGGASAWSVPLDMARIGQMLLNKGAYGNMRFMSERTFALLLPPPGGQYGLGSMWFSGEAGLGAGTFGHGAKSMATLRIDPQNGLVIAMARNRPGQNFVIYHPKFIQAIVAGIDR